MALSNELSLAFYEARKGNTESLNYLVDYFTQNVVRQLANMHLDSKEYNKKISLAYQVIFRNLNTCYEAGDFITRTFEDLKKVIYLDNTLAKSSSKDILSREDANVRKIILNTDLDKLNLPIVFREVARMYYFEEKSVKELAEIFKCSETIIYFRLRKVADSVLGKSENFKDRSTYFRR